MLQIITEAIDLHVNQLFAKNEKFLGLNNPALNLGTSGLRAAASSAVMTASRVSAGSMMTPPHSPARCGGCWLPGPSTGPRKPTSQNRDVGHPHGESVTPHDRGLFDKVLLVSYLRIGVIRFRNLPTQLFIKDDQ